MRAIGIIWETRLQLRGKDGCGLCVKIICSDGPRFTFIPIDKAIDAIKKLPEQYEGLEGHSCWVELNHEKIEFIDMWTP